MSDRMFWPALAAPSAILPAPPRADQAAAV